MELALVSRCTQAFIGQWEKPDSLPIEQSQQWIGGQPATKARTKNLELTGRKLDWLFVHAVPTALHLMFRTSSLEGLSMQNKTSDHNSLASKDHYLKQELYQLVRNDPSIFDFLQSGSLDGIWYWDLETLEDEWMSDRFWALFGYQPGEMPHKASAWQDMIDPHDREQAVRNAERHMKDPNFPYDQVVRYRHRNGHTIWVRCRGLAIRDSDGKPIRMLGAHTDLTALMRSEEELKHVNQNLLAKNAELEQFAYAASHDIQAPIRSLTAMLSILQQDHAPQLDDDGRKILELAITASERVGALTRGILEFTRVGSPTDSPTQVDIDDVIKAIRNDLQFDLKSKQIDLISHRLPTLFGYETAIRLLFQNLISNAIKFSKHENARSGPATIKIIYRESNDYHRFSVQDHGIGIDKKSLDEVFGMFTKLHTQRQYDGTGLGLSLCQRAVMLHQGRIWIESELGHGTTVHFTIHKHLVRNGK